MPEQARAGSDAAETHGEIILRAEPAGAVIDLTVLDGDNVDQRGVSLTVAASGNASLQQTAVIADETVVAAVLRVVESVGVSRVGVDDATQDDEPNERDRSDGDGPVVEHRRTPRVRIADRLERLDSGELAAKGRRRGVRKASKDDMERALDKVRSQLRSRSGRRP